MKNKELVVNFPESLRLRPQWILWKYETRTDKTTGKGNITKVPYQPNGNKAAVNRPDEWVTFDECIPHADGYDGMGFVFTEGLIGIDLDKCFEFDGSLKPFAQDALLAFDSYTEKSPSGNGLHIIIESDVTLNGRKKNGIECYSTGRFFTVTGDVFQGRNALKDCDIASWHREIFGEERTTPMVAIMDTGYLPSDEKILSVMFRSKGGRKTQSLYEQGAWQAQGYGSQSEADLALAGSLMFFCKNNQTVVDRLFRRSKLMRDKWDEKRGELTYGQWTIREATKADVMEWREPTAVVAEGSSVEFIMSGGENPRPLLILENVCLATQGDVEFHSLYRLNDFSHAIEVRRDDVWGSLQDIDILDAQRNISRKWYWAAKISKEMTVDVIRHIAYQTRINPPVDYLRGLVWDKTSRLEFWLHLTFGVPNDELHEKMGANWIKGLVSRVLHPGCQFDQVLVLEGPQGWRKSTALRVLGAPWHVESTLSTEDRDFYMLLARNVIVEFSEGEIVGRTSARRLKAIITKTEDSYRAPYERGLQTFKRGCVFAMTTNDNDYQKDETGGRRWLPVVLKKIADIDWLRENRDQIFAEAVYRVETMKETVYEYPQEELMRLQEEKTEEDGYAEAIVTWYQGLPDAEKEKGITPTMAYHNAIDAGRADLSKETIWRVTGVLRGVLKLTSRVKRVGDQTHRRWCPS